MASGPKNTCVSEAGVAVPNPGSDVAAGDGDVPRPENLLEEYKALRERFREDFMNLPSLSVGLAEFLISWGLLDRHALRESSTEGPTTEVPDAA